MKKYQGMVFFIDILGFSALTKGQVSDVSKHDYEAWGLNSVDMQNPIYLAANIIVEFREVLCQLKKKYPNLNVAQLSDGAFVWCDDAIMVLKAVHYLMWNLVIHKGILCRGGISFGEIIEMPEIDQSLGAFIVGEAVSCAVKNEGCLKGNRVTMDLSVPDAFWDKLPERSIGCEYSADLFHPCESEIDYRTVDEYRWFLCSDDQLSMLTNDLNHDFFVQMTRDRLKLVNVLKLHPRMGWNSRSVEGLHHLSSGVCSLTKNRLLNVLHNFESAIVEDGPRSMTHYLKANALVDKDTYYHVNQEEMWRSALVDLD